MLAVPGYAGGCEPVDPGKASALPSTGRLDPSLKVPSTSAFLVCACDPPKRYATLRARQHTELRPRCGEKHPNAPGLRCAAGEREDKDSPAHGDPEGDKD